MDLKVAPVSVHEQVAGNLRNAILAGVFRPGERLVEADLCQRLGVSRPSLREALRSLAAEKLIEIVPNRGPLVPVITWEQADEIYEVRILLEGAAAAALAKRAKAEDLRKLRAALTDFIAADNRSDAAGRLGAASQFYDAILNGSGNSVIHDILRGLHARVTFLRARSMATPGRAKESAREMKAILNTIAAGDAKAARKAATVHVENARDAARASFAIEAD